MKTDHQQPHPTRTIPLGSIDLEDRLFVITFAPDLEALRDSLARAGMIHPPLVQEFSAEGRYRVVCGFKRILAARELGWERLTVEAVRAGENDLELFLRGLDDNLGTRPLNVVEKALALDRLRNRFEVPEEKILRTHLPRLGLGSDPRTLALSLALAGLEEEILGGLAGGELSLSAARRLTERTPGERRAFFRLVHLLRPGKNLQREFLDLLADIGQREKVTFDAILAEEALSSPAADDEIPAPQRLKTVRERLLRRRYPRFSEVMDRYEKLRREFRLPPRMALSPPPFFEGRDWRLAVTFRDREELEGARKILGDLLDHPLLERLLSFPLEKEEES